MKITVFGADRPVGRWVTRLLNEQGHIVTDITPSSTPDFSWASPESWTPYLGGADAVVVPPQHGEAGVAALAQLLDSIRAARVHRIVALGWREATERERPFNTRREQLIHESGLDWTIIRATWLMQHFFTLNITSQALRQGQLSYVSGDAGVPFADAVDVARVAVTVITAKGSQHLGVTYDVTGPNFVSVPEAIATMAAEFGRNITAVPVNMEEFEAEFAASGANPDAIYHLCTLQQQMLDGTIHGITSTVRDVTGKEPGTFTNFIRRAVADPELL